MCVLMCNFVSYFVCVILCVFVFLCDILLPSGVINDDCDVKILAFWLETAYSRPFLGSFLGIFSHMTSPIVLTPKRHFLGRNHVI